MNAIPNFCLVRHSVGIFNVSHFPGRVLIKQNDLGRKYHSPTSTEAFCEAEEELTYSSQRNLG